jgi:phage-related protein
MTTPTFNPGVSPSAGLLDKPELKLLEAEFGDGYSAPTPDGLNHIRRVLTLKFELLETDERDVITGFLVARKGVEPFLYTLPGEATAIAYTCKDWSSEALGADMFDVAATLKQTFRAAS